VDRRSWNRKVLYCALGLAAIVVALYWRALDNQFVNFDDDTYVFSNDHVKAGLTLDGLRWAFTDISNGNWHPLTWLTHMLDVQWFGMNAADHHLVSVLWHAANSALLLAALWYMTGCLWRSAFVAALFALHPLRVESVAWVSERKDVLSSFFYFSTIWCYAWYTRRPQSWARYAAVAGLLSLGLMSKPSVVTAPFLLLLLDYWPLRRQEPLSVLLREKIPFFALAIAVSVATFFGQREVGATKTIDHLSLSDRLANPVISYVRYLAKIFWPHPLAVLYPFERNLSMLSAAASCLLLLAISIVVILRGRRFRYLPVGWFWFLGVMVPMVGLVQVGWQGYADRYTYVPSVGIFIALVWLAADSIENLKARREIAIAAALILFPALAFATWSQLPYWHDDVTLFQHAIDATPANPLAQYHVGDDLLEQGHSSEAIPHLEEVVRLRPGFLYAGYYTLGKAQAKEGKTELAIQNLSEAVRLKPDYADAYYSRGVMELNIRNPQAAEPDFRAALQYGLSVQYTSDAHNALGVIQAQRGDLLAATQQFEQAIQIQPSSVDPQRNLALTLINSGRPQDAIVQLKRAVSATHGDAGLRQMLADLQAR
jgi:tetratricopeptide (TPR) repeat protein